MTQMISPELNINLDAGLDLQSIMVMSLCTVSWQRTKLSYPDLQYEDNMIPKPGTATGSHTFMLREEIRPWNQSLIPIMSIPMQRIWLSVVKKSLSVLRYDLSIKWTSWVTSLYMTITTPKNMRRWRSSSSRKGNSWGNMKMMVINLQSTLTS